MRIFNKMFDTLGWSRQTYFRAILLVLFLTYVASAVFQMYKPMPGGLEYNGQPRPSYVEFLSDQTYIDANGKKHSEQQIFDAVLTLIEQAQTTIVIDMFLFNPEHNTEATNRKMVQEVTQALLRKKRLNPNMDIRILADPINTVYGSLVPEHLHQLQKAGVEIIYTDLSALRAPNPAWSGFWFMCCQNLGNTPNGGWLPNPFGTGKITLRSYLDLMNLKANHRKTIVVDTVDGWKAMVASANFHDASAQNSNVAIIVHDKAASDVLKTEVAAAKMSGADFPRVILPNPQPNSNLPQVRVLTEKAIYYHVLDTINNLQADEEMDLLMFYLSERKIIKAIKAAQDRGVKIRIILDPNKDAFGLKKNGIPNHQTAWELNKAHIPVRWCATHGEQCHSKMLIVTKADGHKEIILGSANYTARNLKNYNLETDVAVTGKATYPAMIQAQQYFERAWRNADNRQITVDYDQYKDESWLKYYWYRFMEWSGFSTF